jgi:predicted DNA-binding transcriptional regulator AlpA
MAANGTAPEFMTTKQVSDLVGNSVDWLIRARADPGKGPPYYRLGGRICYREAEIMTWIRQSRRE